MKKSLLVLGLVAIAGAVTWQRRRPFAVTVRGASMAPALADGDACLVWGAGDVALRVGDVVVARHPLYPGEELIKRVVRVAAAADDGCWLEGDSPDGSLDSRELGPFPQQSIAGRVVGVYSPLRRAKIFKRT